MKAVLTRSALVVLDPENVCDLDTPQGEALLDEVTTQIELGLEAVKANLAERFAGLTFVVVDDA